MANKDSQKFETFYASRLHIERKDDLLALLECIKQMALKFGLKMAQNDPLNSSLTVPAPKIPPLPI